MKILANDSVEKKPTKNGAKFAALREEALKHFSPGERIFLGVLPTSALNKLRKMKPSAGHSGMALPNALESRRALSEALRKNCVGLMGVTDTMSRSLMLDATRFPEMAPENLKALAPSEGFVSSLNVLVAKPILGLDLGDRELTKKVTDRLFYFLEHCTDRDFKVSDFARSEIWACAYAISILKTLEILKWRKTILSCAVSEELLSRDAFRRMLPMFWDFKRKVLAA